MERGVGDVEVEAGGAQTGMAEQQLDATQVDPGFEQMCRKWVVYLYAAENSIGLKTR